MSISQEKITTFLFDLDGVIRNYYEKDTTLVEKKYGLELGTFDKVAFTDDLLISVTTGILKRHEWIEIIGIKINNLLAAFEWGNRPLHLDNEVLNMIKILKSRGFPICLLTNGTDNLFNELCDMGLEQEFTHIFNSAELGFAKPSPKIYKIVMERLNLRPENIAFIDDNKENVFVAQNLGIQSLHFNGIDTLKEWLENNFI